MHDTIHGDVKQHPYRTARVSDITLVVPRDTVELLEEQLAEAAGERRDNHTVYEIVQDDRPPVYIFFRDLVAIFGTSIEKGSL